MKSGPQLWYITQNKNVPRISGLDLSNDVRVAYQVGAFVSYLSYW